MPALRVDTFTDCMEGNDKIEIKLSSVIFVGTNYNSAQLGNHFYGWVLTLYEFYGLFSALYQTVYNTWAEYKVHFLQN